METFLQQIDDLSECLLRMAILILDGKEVLPKKMLPEVIGKISAVFPRIIETCSRPDMPGLYGDAGYWTDQLGRLMAMLDSDDWFLALDVLVFETRDNLLRYKESLAAAEREGETAR